MSLPTTMMISGDCCSTAARMEQRPLTQRAKGSAATSAAAQHALESLAAFLHAAFACADIMEQE